MKSSTTNRMNVFATTGLAVLLLAGPATATGQSRSSFGLEAGLRHDSNIGLATDGDDEIDDYTARLAATIQYPMLRVGGSEVLLSGGVHYDHVSDVSDISNYGASASVRFRGRFGSDRLAPWFSLYADITGLKYSDSEIRDGYKWGVTATLGKPLHEKFAISGGYRFRQRKSTDDSPGQPNVPAFANASEVFDLDQWGLFAQVQFAPAESTRLYGEYSYFSGDVVSTGRTVSNGGQFAQAADQAFGAGFMAWKIDADINLFELGVSHNFSTNLNVDIAAEYLDADGESGNDYDNLALVGKGVYRF
mgnify:CR=1 FL=1